jgi:hypothetical protein
MDNNNIIIDIFNIICLLTFVRFAEQNECVITIKLGFTFLTN